LTGWRQSITKGKTRRQKVVVRQFAGAKRGLLAGDDPALHTTNTDNDLEMKRVAEQKKFEHNGQGL
jgi:hypothetical protein